MSAVQCQIVDLLKEKSNQMNDKFQRLQNNINRALKEAPQSVETANSNQRVYDEIKIKAILSEFSFEMNKLDGKYYNLCHNVLSNAEIVTPKIDPLRDVVDKQQSLYVSNKERIDSEHKNTLNPNSHCRTNAALSKSIPELETYCEICHRDFITASRLKEHRLSVHSDARPFQCSECPKDFKLKKFLMHHIRQAHDGYPYSCNQCDQRFKRFNEQQAHLKSHGQSKNQPTFECEICSKTFGSKASLRGHKNGGAHRHGQVVSNLENGHNYQCEHCVQSFPRRSTLNCHIRDVHNLPPFKCEVSGCSATFHWNRDFREHQKRHVSRSNRVDSQTVHDPNHRIHRPLKRRRILTDSRDHRWSPRNKRAAKAISKEFGGISSFQCSICGKQLSSKNTLRDHKMLHGDKRPFACHMCSSAFVNKDRLTTHMIEVHKVLSFWCNVCDIGFGRLKDLKDHQRDCLNAVHIDGGADVEDGVDAEKEVDGVRSE